MISNLEWKVKVRKKLDWTYSERRRAIEVCYRTKVEGKKTRGRRRIGIIDELMLGTYGQIKRRAEVRVGWRSWTPGTCLTAEHS